MKNDSSELNGIAKLHKHKSQWPASLAVTVISISILFPPLAVAQKPSDAEMQDALWACLVYKSKGVERDIGDPAKAFNPNTGQNFFYDNAKKAWVDAKTGQQITPKNLEDALWCCLRTRSPGVERDIGDHTRAFNPKTGQNFFYDAEKQAWIDAKTGECVCPRCKPKRTVRPAPSPTPPTEHVLRTQPDLFEFGFGYNYIYAPEEDVRNLHGFDANVFVNANSWLSFGGDFMGGFGERNFGDFDVSLDRYVYVFGPRISIRPCDRFRLFGEALFGGVHDNTDITSRTVVLTSGTYSASAFAMAFGGGADWRFADRWSWRIIQADYLATHFGGSWQDNMRVSTGIVFSFGGKKESSTATYDTKDASIRTK